MLSFSDFENMDNRICNMVAQKTEVTRDGAEFPPTLEELEDSNKSYELNAAVLFIDIRQSTKLMEENPSEIMVKIYRIFMRAMVECVRKNGGVTRQFLGDRIMGIFKDGNKNEDNACNKAISAARDMQTAIDFIVNKHLSNKFDGKTIACGIGVDYGKILVTKVGMHGLENDESRENELDFVWIGNATNHASKYADLASGGEIFISTTCKNNLSTDYQEMGWHECVKSKGDACYKGHVIFNSYSECIDKLGSQYSSNELVDANDNLLINAIDELEKLQNKLIDRERQIAVYEAEISKENEGLKLKVEEYSKKNESLLKEKNSLKHKYSDVLAEYYDCLVKIVGSWHCASSLYKERFANDSVWKFYITELYRVGKLLGYTEDEITGRSDCGLMEIYMYVGMPEDAFNTLLIMAKTCDVWINLRPDIMQWAKDNYSLGILERTIKQRLDNYEIPIDKRKQFAGYLYKIKEIRGW